jgi:hypothetical protein
VSVSELKRMKGLEAENAKNSGADIKLARRRQTELTCTRPVRWCARVIKAS